jgi:ABC-type transporter lipoprotein component MlaA
MGEHATHDAYTCSKRPAKTLPDPDVEAPMTSLYAQCRKTTTTTGGIETRTRVRQKKAQLKSSPDSYMIREAFLNAAVKRSTVPIELWSKSESLSIHV